MACYVNTLDQGLETTWSSDFIPLVIQDPFISPLFMWFSSFNGSQDKDTRSEACHFISAGYFSSEACHFISAGYFSDDLSIVTKRNCANGDFVGGFLSLVAS